jgi:hypothetical protein
MTRRIAIVLVLATACRGGNHVGETKQAVKATHSAATQAELARELDDAERRGTQAAVKQRWQGLALHWTVTRQRLLCLTAEACHVAPFAIERPAKHGWMPALAFAPGEFEKIEAGCGNAAQCELEVEGKLDLDVSPEQPTSMKFSGVKVLRAVASTHAT